VPEGRYLYVGGSAATLLQVLLLGPLLGRAEGKKLRLLAVRLSAERVGCQKSIVAVTSSSRLTKVLDAPSLARFPWRRSGVVWSFVYLALRRALELILLCFRSAHAKEIEILM
jgi:hypothetical protein